jgi:hypothetical protein
MNMVNKQGEANMTRITKDDIQSVIDNFAEYPEDASVNDVVKFIASDLEDLAENHEIDQLKQTDLDRIWKAALTELSKAESNYSIAFVRGVKRGLNITAPFIID